MLTKDDIKVIVAEQVCNMIDNDIVHGFGGESFEGWLDDGDIFANGDEPFSDEEIEQIMAFVREIAPLVDDLSWKLDPNNED